MLSNQRDQSSGVIQNDSFNVELSSSEPSDFHSKKLFNTDLPGDSASIQTQIASARDADSQYSSGHLQTSRSGFFSEAEAKHFAPIAHTASDGTVIANTGSLSLLPTLVSHEDTEVRRSLFWLYATSSHE